MEPALETALVRLAEHLLPVVDVLGDTLANPTHGERPATHRDLILSEERLSQALAQLNKKLDTIMTAISDFAAKQTAFNTRLNTSVDNIVADIKGLNDLIKKLQDSQGQISAEDQATLDQLQAAGSELADKAEALDAQTPPTIPSTNVPPATI